MTPAQPPWISAASAARLLGVKRQTLYAYVSRGRLRSQVVPGHPRERTYSRDDVERLRQRGEHRRAPEKTAESALHWGFPVLESAITLIDGQQLFYRGENVLHLAEHRSVEDVAALIWTGDMSRRLPQPRPLGRPDRPRARTPFIERAQSLLAESASRDHAAFDQRLDAVVRTGWQIVWLLTLAACRAGQQGSTATIDAALCRAWRMNRAATSVLRAALILCADHELNVSSFTARCIASAGSPLYGVVIGGLAALEGPRHGGASARVEAALASLRHSRRLPEAVADRLRRGEPFDGFGHPLYKDGDPRAAALLRLLEAQAGRTADFRYVAQVARTVTATTGQQPNLDFALAAMARVLQLPPGSPLVLFAIGRSIGWIGHAIEQYAAGQLIRPRARYVGVVPQTGYFLASTDRE